MLDMSGDRKKEACDKLDSFELELGSAGLTESMECGGDYPAAYKHAKAFCANDGDDDGHMCNTAKALVRLYVGFGKVDRVGALTNHCMSFLSRLRRLRTFWPCWTCPVTEKEKRATTLIVSSWNLDQQD